MYDEPNTTGRPRLPVQATVSRSTSPAGAFGDDGVEPCDAVGGSVNDHHIPVPEVWSPTKGKVEELYALGSVPTAKLSWLLTPVGVLIK